MLPKEFIILITFFQQLISSTKPEKALFKRERICENVISHNDDLSLPKRMCIEGKNQLSSESLLFDNLECSSHTTEPNSNNLLMALEEYKEAFFNPDDALIDQSIFFIDDDTNNSNQVDLFDKTWDLPFEDQANLEKPKIPSAYELALTEISSQNKNQSDAELLLSNNLPRIYDTNTIEPNKEMYQDDLCQSHNDSPSEYEYLQNLDNLYLQENNIQNVESKTQFNRICKKTYNTDFCDILLDSESLEDYLKFTTKNNFDQDAEVTYRDLIETSNKDLTPDTEIVNGLIPNNLLFESYTTFLEDNINNTIETSCLSDKILHQSSFEPQDMTLELYHDNDHTKCDVTNINNYTILDISKSPSSSFDILDSEQIFDAYINNSDSNYVESENHDMMPVSQYSDDISSVKNYSKKSIIAEMTPLLKIDGGKSDIDLNSKSSLMENQSEANIIVFNTQFTKNLDKLYGDTQFNSMPNNELNLFNNKEEFIYTYETFCEAKEKLVRTGPNINSDIITDHRETILKLNDLGYGYIIEISNILANLVYFDKQSSNVCLKNLEALPKTYKQGEIPFVIAYEQKYDIIDNGNVSDERDINAVIIKIYDDENDLKNNCAVGALEFAIDYYIRFIEYTCFEDNKYLNLRTVKQSLWGINIYMIEFCFYITWKLNVVKNTVLIKNNEIIAMASHLLKEIQTIKCIITKYNNICLCKNGDQTKTSLLFSEINKYRRFILRFLEERHPDLFATTMYFFALKIKHQEIIKKCSVIQDIKEKDLNGANIMQSEQKNKLQNNLYNKTKQTTIIKEKNAKNMMLLTAFTLDVSHVDLINLAAIRKALKRTNRLSRLFYCHFYRNINFLHAFILNISDVVTYINQVRGKTKKDNEAIIAFPHINHNFILHISSVQYNILILSNTNAMYLYGDYVRSFML